MKMTRDKVLWARETEHFTQILAWISSDYFESLLLPQSENNSTQSDEFQATQILVFTKTAGRHNLVEVVVI